MEKDNQVILNVKRGVVDEQKAGQLQYTERKRYSGKRNQVLK